MIIRITQIDGALPNLALMKIAHWHRAKGDEVVYTRQIERDLFEPDYDVVYGSAIFGFSQFQVMQFQKQWPGAIVGGSGTLPVHQHWWGHRAEKKTRLYIVGCEPKDIPAMPLRIDEPTHVIGDVGRSGKGKRPEVSKAEREHTPPAFAHWLVELARRCHLVTACRVCNRSKGAKTPDQWKGL